MRFLLFFLVLCFPAAAGGVCQSSRYFLPPPPGECRVPRVFSSSPSPRFTEEEVKTIGRLGSGIERTRHGVWWVCGEKVTDPTTLKKFSLEMAVAIVSASKEVSEKIGDRGDWELNPWAVAGVIQNESNFDRCALGKYPRKVAYKAGLLKKSKLSISCKEEDIIRALAHREFLPLIKGTGVDLGLSQLLSRFYPAHTSYGEMMSIEGNLNRMVWELEKRHRIYGTSRPWAYWRGYNCLWYDEKITRWARYLGATKRDLLPPKSLKITVDKTNPITTLIP